MASSRKIVRITEEEVQSLADKWKYAVVGQALGFSPSYFAVNRCAEAKWNSKGLLEVQKVDNDLFVFRFESEDGKWLALEQSPVSFGNTSVLVLRPLNPHQPIQKSSFFSVPLWIKLPGLGLQYYNAKVLGKLGNLIGKPLYIDSCTADQRRIAYARICVEIQAGEELPNEIQFVNEFGMVISQKVEYEWVPPCCLYCKVFGHRTSECVHKLKAERRDKASALKAQVDQQKGVVDNLATKANDGVSALKAQLDQRRGVADDLVSDTPLLESKTQEAKSKKDSVKASPQSAETANKISEMVGNENTSSALSAFERMEEKVIFMESQAEAPNQMSTDELAGKFALLESPSVDGDLAALKKELSGGSKKGDLPPGSMPVVTASSFPLQDSEIEKRVQ